MQRAPGYLSAIIFPFFLLAIGFTSSYAQMITTIAGNGTAGFSGDGGPATAAQLNGEGAIAADVFGNIYVADGLNYRIRRIAADGIISTYAGTGILGYSGDGGQATDAELSWANYVAIDSIGNVYIDDNGSMDVRIINLAGIIAPFAGNEWLTPFTGDGGPATAAFFYDPLGIATDNMGNIYICDHGHARVRKVNASDTINTIAGNGTAGYSGDGGPATDAALNPGNLAADVAGNVYIADYTHYVIRKVSPAGFITTFAGTGVAGFGGDGGPATAAQLGLPGCIATDTLGNLFVCDKGNNRVRKIDASGIITTIAGTGSTGYTGDHGPATSCTFHGPYGIACRWGCGENIYISDGNYCIRWINYYDSHPFFVAGKTQTVSVCIDSSSISLDTMLAITDSDYGQPESWSVLMPPLHGSVVAAYSATSTGGAVFPSGLSYTAMPGYSGIDSFSVAVIDCGNLPDTTTIYISIDTYPAAGIITGPDTACIGMGHITLTDTVAAGLWRTSNTSASIADSMVSGLTTGADTIFYIVTTVCGSDTAQHPVTIVTCPNEVKPMSTAATSAVFPNPNDGTFTLYVAATTNVPTRITITNVQGQVVKQLTGAANNPIDINIDVPAGLYFVNAVTPRGAYRTKVVVEK